MDMCAQSLLRSGTKIVRSKSIIYSSIDIKRIHWGGPMLTDGKFEEMGDSVAANEVCSWEDLFSQTPVDAQTCNQMSAQVYSVPMESSQTNDNDLIRYFRLGGRCLCCVNSSVICELPIYSEWTSSFALVPLE